MAKEPVRKVRERNVEAVIAWCKENIVDDVKEIRKIFGKAYTTLGAAKRKAKDED